MVPVPAALLPDGFELGPALPFFPVVGALLGAAGGGVRVGLGSLLGPACSSALAIVTIVVLSGGLHQDALADCADALGARGDRESRLAVMHDSRVGSFGVLALIGWALTLFSALSAMSAAHALLALIAAGAAGRFAAVLHGRLAAPARTEGLGAALGATSWRALAAGGVAALIALLTVGPAGAGLVIGLALIGAALSASGARWLIGGSGGDTLGATIVLVELAGCLALLALWR